MARRKKIKGIVVGTRLEVKSSKSGCTQNGKDWFFFKHFEQIKNGDNTLCKNLITYCIFENSGKKFNDGDWVMVKAITGVYTEMKPYGNQKILQTTLNCDIELVKTKDEVKQMKEDTDNIYDLDESYASPDSIVVDDESSLPF